MKEIRLAIQRMFDGLGNGILSDFLPLLRLIKRDSDPLEHHMEVLRNFITGLLEERKRKIHSGEVLGEEKSFLDLIVQEMENSSTATKQSEWVYLLIDMLITGTETIQSALIWVICGLTTFPNHADKAYEEITKVIGSKTPTVNDMDKLPFTRAVIYEAMRYYPFVPLLPPRAVTALDGELKIEGFDIPEGTVVISNYYYTCKSRRFWKEPDTFKPERFFSADGSFSEAKALHFGYGPRSCVGMNLADVTLFVVATSLTQRFKFEFIDKLELQKSTHTFRRPKGNSLKIKASRRI